MMKRKWIAAVVVVGFLASGCGANVAGTYQGQEVFQGNGFNTSSQMQFSLSQSGSTVSGTFTRTPQQGGQLENGSVTGTVSGNQVNVNLITNGFSVTNCPSSQGTLNYDAGNLIGVTTGTSSLGTGGQGGQGGQSQTTCTFNYTLIQTSGQ